MQNRPQQRWAAFKNLQLVEKTCHLCTSVGALHSPRCEMAIKCVTAYCMTARTVPEACIMLQIDPRVRRGFASTVTHREDS